MKRKKGIVLTSLGLVWNRKLIIPTSMLLCYTYAVRDIPRHRAFPMFWGRGYPTCHVYIIHFLSTSAIVDALARDLHQAVCAHPTTKPHRLHSPLQPPIISFSPKPLHLHIIAKSRNKKTIRRLYTIPVTNACMSNPEWTTKVSNHVGLIDAYRLCSFTYAWPRSSSIVLPGPGVEIDSPEEQVSVCKLQFISTRPCASTWISSVPRSCCAP